MTETVSGVGLDKRSELVYRKLLQGPRSRPEELSRELGRPKSDIVEIINGLRADGLVTGSGDDAGAVRAVEPCVALPTLLAKRMRQAGAVQPGPVEVERFIALHERAVERLDPRNSGDGRDQITALIERMIIKVEHAVTFLLPGDRGGGMDGAFELSRPIADMAMRRGAAVRSVWAPSVFQSPPAAAHAQWLAEQGAPPRSVDPVPVRGMIMDGVVAVLADGEDRVRVVRAPEELKRLTALTDRLWDRGVVARHTANRAACAKITRRPRSEIVLRLLAEGLTDEAIARRLGCSVRTVRNDIASAMNALHARSRFQAGVRAMQVGLI
ncbi:LuxR C-terminal-related transcriptional regulator [Streptomyces sp. ACA25]|uniref:helix-turn-helix transcriptional regulator n=1 Tax=Streptomyces sp. ACA25 TaxID=3022596 RepID=UPI002307C01D|nr:LuxR C-terminal-related transcriptional regulator [Streptomyces sp. ACA25]MDB1090195.1 LuxR C-terminal-related transcriptional regulator [Streptomyces sp. ACA25]